MGQYIITITPVAANGAVEAQPSQMSMRIDAKVGQVHVRELTVKIPEGARVASGDVFNVDLDLLAQAFAQRSVGEDLPVVAPVAVAVAASAADEGGRPLVKRSTVARSDGRAPTDRAYRRMPDPAELAATYLKTRTITGVAEHFGVPTHTAQGWIGRLRRKGVLPENK